MCIHLTSELYLITTVITEVYLLCLIESVTLRDIGKPTSRAEISSSNSLYLKAVKGAHLGSALLLSKEQRNLHSKYFPDSKSIKIVSKKGSQKRNFIPRSFCSMHKFCFDWYNKHPCNMQYGEHTWNFFRLTQERCYI